MSYWDYYVTGSYNYMLGVEDDVGVGRKGRLGDDRQGVGVGILGKKKKKKGQDEGKTDASLVEKGSKISMEQVVGTDDEPDNVYLMCMKALCWFILTLAMCGGFVVFSFLRPLDPCRNAGNEIQKAQCEYDTTCLEKDKEIQYDCPQICFFGYRKDESGCDASCKCASGSRSFESDIAFDTEGLPALMSQYDAIGQYGSTLFRSTSDGTFELWTDHVVDGRVQIPYAFEFSNDTSYELESRKALLLFPNRTCIDFVPVSDHHRVYLRFVVGQSCWSFVGKIKTANGQTISVAPHCRDYRSITHEVMHALGFMHEHTRPDRDSYITIDFENVQPGKAGFFRKRNEYFSNDIGSEYDTQSIMHFNAFRFAAQLHKPVIYDRKTGKALTTGEAVGLSENDISDINALYCTGTGSFGQRPVWTSWGEWSHCYATCGPASRSRYRRCNRAISHVSCKGFPRQREDCPGLKLCPDPHAWQSWQEFGKCVGTCEHAFQLRSRRCRSGYSCHGVSFEVKTCKKKECSLLGGKPFHWSPWSILSPCSASRGAKGSKIRLRVCYNTIDGGRALGCHGVGLQTIDCSYKTSKALRNGHTAGQMKIFNRGKPKVDLFSKKPSFLKSHRHCWSVVGQSSWIFGDFDGENRVHIACHYQHTIAFNWFEPPLDTGWKWTERWSTCVDGVMHTHDVNGDGLDDVICTRTNNDVMEVRLSEGERVLSELFLFKYNCYSANDRIYFLDVNGDHRADILCAHNNGIQLRVYINQFKRPKVL